jgi:hypothetical protein
MLSLTHPTGFRAMNRALYDRVHQHGPVFFGHMDDGSLTAVKVLVHHCWDGALVHLRDALRFERGAIDVTRRVHGPLKRVVLPPEHVVTMGPEASAADCQPLVLSSPLTSKTYLSSIDHTNGCEPSSGHSSGSLNWAVSQMVSYISCGTRTGCDAGQGPPLSKVPSSGYDMCAM